MGIVVRPAADIGMSLRTIGYLDGKPIRVNEGASGINWSGPIRGGAIESEPGPYDRQRQAEYQQQYVARKLAEQPPKPDERCAIEGRCHHPKCVSARARRARELYATTQMTLREIGQALGGRDHSTVIYWLRKMKPV
jgi:hypothetical protein